MANTDFGNPSGGAPRRNQIFEAVRAVEDCSGAFADEQSVKRALSALRRGPIRFRRNNVIACEGDAADYIFLVVGGVVRSCKTFKNGSRSVVAFYLPGALFGWSDQNYSLSVEAASDAMVLFFKRKALASVAARENRVSSFLLELATIELRRAQEHALLMSRSAKCRVAAFLTDLSKRSGRTGLLSLPMSHQDIADHLGLSIETLSRAITELERTGLVARVSHRTLMVRNDYALSHLMD
jgi:CRP/FNR family transcriptional regulator, nitrogen fixation regulation protein